MRGKHSLKHGKTLKGAKLLVMSMALTLVLCTIIGGTVAWLITATQPVVNTFTYGDINIELEETDADGDGDPDANDYPMIPGHTIEKDPKVTFKADSENAWLFVKLEESANFDTFLTYDIADGWTALANETGVYYREVTKAETDAVFTVLKGDDENPDGKVTVNGNVTKADLNALDADPDNKTYPTLTVTAYAVQRDSNIASATAAWELVEAESTNP